MNGQLDWLVGQEDGTWERIAKIDRHPRPRLPKWARGVAVVASLVLAIGGWFATRFHYRQALRRIAFQIQNVIDLEAGALERGDLDLYLAQQDATSPGWISAQAARARLHCLDPAAGSERSGSQHVAPWDCRARLHCLDPAASSERSGSQHVAPWDSAHALPARIERVEMRGDVAWVEVVSREDLVRRVRFYRHTDLGWRHTAPLAAFWGDKVTLDYGRAIVHCSERDRAYVEPLAREILRTWDGVSRALRLPSTGTLEVSFGVEDGPPRLSADGISLPSPWLSGVPVQGRQDKVYLDELAYWVAYDVMSRAVCPDARSTLGLPQKAVLDEVAILYSRGDIRQVPLVRRIIEQHGFDAVPELIRSLQDARSTSLFVARWLPALPSEENAYLAAIADILCEADRAGRRDTFDLFCILFSTQDHQWQDWVQRVMHSVP